VIDVQPIVRVVRIETPRRECWTEEVTRQEPRNTTGATLAGAVIGGVIGSQIGKGSGRKAATAGGAVVGGAIGNSSASGTTARTSVEQRCNVHTEFHEEQRTDGYRVTYEYGGAAYVTRTARHPGDRLRVQVSIRPAAY
jgi:uncharacterized protein YcfJ